MNYHALYKTDMVNGEGVRVTLFVGGCDHACKGCYNQSTWNPDNGKLFDKSALDEVIEALRPDHIAGLSLTGGDPLFQRNLDVIQDLVDEVRWVYGNTKNIWLWTGYTLEDLMLQGGHVGRKRRSILKEVDVLIDGKFEQDKHEYGLPFRGSTNQIIHRMKV
ncbi:MAG: anaerobic ribonucleoside-triphosphate reductase activating protein [Bacteroidales bacterium]